MTNNDILKKLRVALQLRDGDIIEILSLVDFEITKGALGDFFRAEDHPSYIEAGDQVLRNFLNGLVIYKRGPGYSSKSNEGLVKEDDHERKSVPVKKEFNSRNTNFSKESNYQKDYNKSKDFYDKGSKMPPKKSKPKSAADQLKNSSPNKSLNIIPKIEQGKEKPFSPPRKKEQKSEVRKPFESDDKVSGTSPLKKSAFKRDFFEKK